jgi:inorganic pyrophosphatase
MPGELQKVFEWFRDYKTPDGKPENKFGYNNNCLNKAFTDGVIEETHGFWVRLRSGARDKTDLSTI